MPVGPVPLRNLVLPGAGFSLLLLAAAGVLFSSGRDPRAALYREATRTLSLAEGGDGSAAPDLAHWALDRRGWLGQIAGLEVLPDGSEGRVEVVWSDPEGRARALEVLGFGRAPDGGWRFTGSRPEALR